MAIKFDNKEFLGVKWKEHYALEGRSSMSNPALVKAPSVSTLEYIPPIGAGDFSHRLMPSRSRSKKRRPVTNGPDEVRDVLSKLGIGKQNGNSLLKASFPTFQKTDQRSSSAPHPYRA